VTERSYSKRDIENLQAIIKYCGDIEELITLHGSDEEDFQENLSLQYSCAFSLIQIGEHVKRLSDIIRDAHKEVDWRGAAAMRDFTAHNYMRINIPRMRTTLLEEVPLLKKECIIILENK
jgi:uncharacterized protein with HEPN domain